MRIFRKASEKDAQILATETAASDPMQPTEIPAGDLPTQRDQDVEILNNRKRLVRHLFDEEYYLAHNPDIAQAGIDPLEHYLNFGEKEERWPQASFDPAFYVARYADTLTGLGALEHFALHGKELGNVTLDDEFDFEWYKQVYLSPSACAADCRHHYHRENRFNLLRKRGDAALIALRQLFRPDEYIDLYPDIKDLDPWIHFVGAGYLEGRKLSYWYRPNFGDIKSQALAIRKQGWMLRGIDVALDRLSLAAIDKLESSGGKVIGAFDEALLRAFKDVSTEISSLVVVGGLGIGGAERYGTNIFRALTNIYGSNNVVILVSDGDIGLGAQWLPADAKVLAISEYLPDADRAMRARFVRRFISVVQPQTTYCVNSRALWDAAMQPKNALDKFSRFYAALFCYDYDEVGNRVGYAATEFFQCFEFFSGYLIDNRSFAEELIGRFSIPVEHQRKLQVVRSPANNSSAMVPPVERPMRVLWCGRLARQKIPHIVGQIAALCPGIGIDMFAAQGDISISAADLPSNVRVHPAYDPERGAPFEHYGAFIYTSQWDGIPTILLDAASSGIPIVGSIVGGIGELLTEETGWPVSDPHNARQYVDRLFEALFEPAEAQKRTRAMLRLLQDKHSWENFESNIRQIELGA